MGDSKIGVHFTHLSILASDSSVNVTLFSVGWEPQVLVGSIEEPQVTCFCQNIIRNNS